MTLRDNLYSINDKVTEGTAVRYDIRLDAAHVIYQAHFPGEPITPGVCIIQIAKELLEDHLHLSLDIQTVKNVKFLSVISPVATPQVTYVLDKITEDPETQTCKVQVAVSAADTPLAKLSFTCHAK